MTCIADANVLFPLLVQGHAAHHIARRWWGRAVGRKLSGPCLLTRLAVLRLLTNKIAMNGIPITPDEAVRAWRQLQNDPRSLQIEAEPIDHEPRFVALISGREPHAQSMDRRLASCVSAVAGLRDDNV